MLLRYQIFRDNAQSGKCLVWQDTYQSGNCKESHSHGSVSEECQEMEITEKYNETALETNQCVAVSLFAVFLPADHVWSNHINYDMAIGHALLQGIFYLRKKIKIS